jgi:hypothetical protein
MRRKKSWADLSRGQQVATAVMSAIQIGLQAWALWDLAHRSDDEINGSRKTWVAVSFVNFAGPIAYFCFGRKRIGAEGAAAPDEVSEPPASAGE